jgi:uncharacterized protein YacL
LLVANIIGVVFGLIIPNIFTIHGILFRVLVLIISIIVIIIIWFIYAGLSSLDHRSNECYKRMREIEDVTDLEIQKRQNDIKAMPLKKCWRYICIMVTILWGFSIVIDSILLGCSLCSH